MKTVGTDRLIRQVGPIGRGGLVAIALIAGWCLASAAESDAPAIRFPEGSRFFETLHREHPRLLWRAPDIEALRRRVAADSLASDWHARIRRQAAAILDDPVSRYEIPDGLRLLSTSRRVLDRTYTLSLVHLLDPQPKWEARLWRELEAAAAFPDWNPRHFLDTAEMGHAFAIAYDWLHASWSAEERAALRQAMVAKALDLGVKAYRGETTYGWWTRSRHNWNQVCNGGIGMVALALAAEEEALAIGFLTNAVRSLLLPSAEYAPDGAWAEGPGYWHYATSYHVAFLAALESALGTDFGLSQMPGFDETGWFPLHLTGPTEMTFNYADGGASTIRAPQLFWLAQKFRQPALAAYQQAHARPTPLDLLWYRPTQPGQGKADAPRARHFRNADIVCMRTAWDNPQAMFVGFKAGDNRANHSNLDLGTFVLDGLGKRWAVDLGADNYNLPAYFGKNRWTYYRLRAEGHNTLVIDPDAAPDQDPQAKGAIEKFHSGESRAFALADLTRAYAPKADAVRRGVGLLADGRVAVQDEIGASQPRTVWWFMHTPARIELAGSTAILRQGDKSMRAEIVAPAGAEFQNLEAQPLPGLPNPAGQAENRDVRKLAIRLDNVRDARLLVVLTPQAEGGQPAAKPVALRPLAEWSATAP